MDTLLVMGEGEGGSALEEAEEADPRRGISLTSGLLGEVGPAAIAEPAELPEFPFVPPPPSPPSLPPSMRWNHTLPRWRGVTLRSSPSLVLSSPLRAMAAILLDRKK